MRGSEGQRGAARGSEGQRGAVRGSEGQRGLLEDTLVLWGGVVTCVSLVYVTLRGGSFDELEDHEAGSDSDDDGKVGVARGNGAVRRRR